MELYISLTIEFIIENSSSILIKEDENVRHYLENE
jgi:hypothetical protein